MTNVINNISNVSTDPLFEDSFNLVRPELDSLPPEEIIQVNLEITSAVTTAFGAWPEIRALRDNIAKQIPGFDLARFDKLLDYAKALSFAATQYSIATQPTDDLQPIQEESLRMRENLFADVTALIRHGLIAPETIKGLKGPNGYKNTAIDLQMLASILKNDWAKVEGRCASQLDEINFALKLAGRMLEIVGRREQGPAIVAAAADMRMRAFTLFTRAYDDARRAVIYLRWNEGDADAIAPSLYAGRSNGRKKPTEEPKDKPVTPTPVVNPPHLQIASGNVAAETKPDISEVGPFMH